MNLENVFFDNRRLWTRAAAYRWDGDRLVQEGPFTHYNPFDAPFWLYDDFYRLLNTITEYRDAFFYNAGVEEGEYRRNSKYSEKRSKTNLKTAYKQFAEKWGMLGVGYCRITGIYYTHSQPDGSIGYSAKPRRLSLREISNGWEYTENFSLWCVLSSDFDAPGKDVDIEDWKRQYGGLYTQDYHEEFQNIVTCSDILDIREDSLSQESKPFSFHSLGMTSTAQGISWSYNSLIQAIRIMYALNKAGQLKEPWKTCPVCKGLFLFDNPRQIYCGDRCKEVMHKRNQRAKQKEEAADNG